MVVALFAIPSLISGLGVERFGVLTLAWLVVGYFSLFDLGLGRALTQVVAARLGILEQGLRATVRTALVVMLALGLIGALAAWLLTPRLVESVFKIPPLLIGETLKSFYILAVSIPVVILTAGLVGILTAYSRFGLINWVRVPLGISNYLIPVFALKFTNDLSIIVGLLSLTRLLAAFVYWMLCRRCMSHLAGAASFDRDGLKILLKFGGWMTLTNIVGPIMIYMDRFVIGSLVSVSAVAFYATPFEMVTKLLIVPAAIVTVLFPALAVAVREIDRTELIKLFDDSWRYVALALFPVVLFIITFSYEGLELWLGDTFAKESSTVLQLLALGVMINAFAQLPFTLIQSAGKPDITAKLHLIELLFYVPCLWMALKTFGIVGAAATWTLRVVVDGALLSRATARLVPETRKTLWDICRFVAVTSSAICLIILAESLVQRIALFCMLAIMFVWATIRLKILPSQFRSRLGLGVADT